MHLSVLIGVLYTNEIMGLRKWSMSSSITSQVWHLSHVPVSARGTEIYCVIL
jgi:hypothetical protein